MPFARAPLLPVALAVAAGLLLDHFVAVPWPATMAAAALGFALHFQRRRAGLFVGLVAVGAGHHHLSQRTVSADSVAHRVVDAPRLIRVRGTLADEPITRPAPPPDALRSQAGTASLRATLAVEAVQTGMAWEPAGGRVLLTVGGDDLPAHTGDRLELLGWLRPLPAPTNPGEPDVRPLLQRRGVCALLAVHRTADAVVVWDDAGPSVAGTFARLRGWGQRRLADILPPDVSPLAAALLLGDGAPLQRDDWDRYIRTGVVHVLAISGQHLVVLAGFLAAVAWLLGWSRRTTAVAVVAFLAVYAGVTGANPPVVRAAVAAAGIGGGVLARRRIGPANALALAWLVVVAANPADAFDSGCQLSFLSVLALVYVAKPALVRDEPDPLEAWQRAHEPVWKSAARGVWAAVRDSYLVAGVVGLAVLPLVAERYHLIAPAGWLIGPPVTLLSSVALVAGFLALISGPLAWPFAWVTAWSLRGADGLVRWADTWPGSHAYLPDLPAGWAVLGYGVALAYWFVPPWRWALRVCAVAWLCWGLVPPLLPRGGDELRVTFLAVGHGGCAVLELPDGRVVLYDAGSLAGPDVAARVIAPFLWHRGIARIDEVLLSHADLDHFNALPAVLDRFGVGQITCTPSFTSKQSAGLKALLDEWQRRGIVPRTTVVGDRWGDPAGATLDVLHPPASGPPGPENVRSLVLRVTHAGHALLLTGDLEGAGQALVLEQPPTPCDILMAPHHGSPTAKPEALLPWCRPRAVVACSGPPKAGVGESPRPAVGDLLWLATGECGAVTVRSRPGGLTVETFAPPQRLVLRAGR